MSKPEIAAKKSIMMDMEPGEYWWCACGKSKSQPFCDGSHQGTEFTPKQIKIEEKQTVFWCQCKRSGNTPFCDGTHKEL
jgi:CDGSH-type Zn-finger protein